MVFCMFTRGYHVFPGTWRVVHGTFHAVPKASKVGSCDQHIHRRKLRDVQAQQVPLDRLKLF